MRDIQLGGVFRTENDMGRTRSGIAQASGYEALKPGEKSTREMEVDSRARELGGQAM